MVWCCCAIRVSVDALCALLDWALGISPVTSYSGVKIGNSTVHQNPEGPILPPIPQPSTEHTSPTLMCVACCNLLRKYSSWVCRSFTGPEILYRPTAFWTNSEMCWERERWYIRVVPVCRNPEVTSFRKVWVRRLAKIVWYYISCLNRGSDLVLPWKRESGPDSAEL